MSPYKGRAVWAAGIVLSVCAAVPSWAPPGVRVTVDSPRPRGYSLDNRSELSATQAARVDAVSPLRPRGAANVLVNGSFEQNGGVGSSKLDGWTVMSVGFGGWYVQSGTDGPVFHEGENFAGFFEVEPPTDGDFAAMTEQTDFGMNILYQDVVVPEDARLSCDLYVQNYSEVYVNAGHLEHNRHVGASIEANQHARVDLMDPEAELDSVTTGVLQNLFITEESDPAEFGYFTLTADLGKFGGQTVRLRFAEVDNLGFFNFGVDNCSIEAASAGGEVEPGDEVEIVPPEVRARTPNVVYKDDGSKAVLWRQNGPGGTIICVQFINRDDSQRTPPLIANSTLGNNTVPTGSYLPNGNLMLFWRYRDGTGATSGDAKGAFGGGLLGQIFGPDGKMVGNELAAALENLQGGNDPELSTDKNGNTVLTFEDGGDVMGLILDEDGKPQGGPIEISSGIGALKPVTDISASGDAVTVFQQTSGGDVGLKAQLFNEKGVLKGKGTFGNLIEISKSPTAKNAAVSMDDDGNFVVVWEDFGSNGLDIFARLFNDTGVPMSSAFQVNVGLEGNQSKPSVDSNAAGDFAVVWQSDTIPSNFLQARGAAGGGLFGSVFDGLGGKTVDEFMIAEALAGSEPVEPDVSLQDKDDLTVVFEREGPGGESEGIFRKEVRTKEAPKPCVESNRVLCVNGGRFGVRARWEDAASGDSGFGNVKRLTDDTMYFWFFQEDNVEVVVKVLDACGFADSFWVFAAGLTNVEVNLRVEDSESGETISFFNTPGMPFQPIQQTNAFATCDLAATGPPDDAALYSALLEETAAEMAALSQTLARDRTVGFAPRRILEKGAGCVPTSTRLCINNNRFAVDVGFRTQQGSGVGRKIKLTNDTGYFWFFEPDNVELVVKVLDACSLVDRFWVFAGGLTNVEVDLTVTDTLTNEVKFYENPLGTAFQPIQDTDAFATCP